MRVVSVVKLFIFSFIIAAFTSCDEDSGPNVYEVSVAVTPDDAGQVFPSASLRVEEGQQLSLLAMPQEAFSFTGWSGEMSGTDNPMSITVDKDMELVANFTIKTYPLTVTTIGNGSVAETILPAAKTTYDHGTLVQLTAVPDDNWEFAGWSGDTTGTDEQITISVTEQTDITATFTFISLEPENVTKTNDTKLYMHYMPWFQSLDVDGYWGSHWTMENQDPDNIVDGKRQIASHYYPQIGPYSSKDPDVLEYQLLLMKLSGIDAVLIDWYGTYNVYDYRPNLEASNALIDKVDDVGIEFAIVYEDRSIQAAVELDFASTIVEAGRQDLEYIQTNYFSSPQYTIINNNPLLLVFTPIYVESGALWSDILANINPKPTFLALWYQGTDLGSTGSGEYGWVYGGNTNHLNDIRNFYGRIGGFDYGIGSAYPGFVDFYEEGGRGDIIGWEIPHNGTATLEATLDLATERNVKDLQLVTWNDYGEGTMIEPTVEFGYSFLEKIQQFAGVPYDTTHLAMVKDLYDLRKEYADNTDVQTQLDQVFTFLAALRMEDASELIEQIKNSSN